MNLPFINSCCASAAFLESCSRGSCPATGTARPGLRSYNSGSERLAEQALRFASLSAQMFLRWANLGVKIYVASVKGLACLICDKH